VPIFLTWCSFLISLVLLPADVRVSALCSGGTPLQGGDEINVAVQVWLINQPVGLYTGDLSDAEPWTSGFGNTVIQPAQLGWDLYIKEMRRVAAQKGTNLRMSNGVWVKVNYYYINIAHVSSTQNGEPLIVLTAVFFQMRPMAEHISLTEFLGAQVPSFCLAFVQASPQWLIHRLGVGAFVQSNHLYDQLISFDCTVLRAAFGITNGLPFTDIVQPMIAIETVNALLPSLGVEDNQTHVLINPMPSSRDASVCDGILDPLQSKTAACLLHNPIRRNGDRRYHTRLGTLGDPSRVGRQQHRHPRHGVGSIDHPDRLSAAQCAAVDVEAPTFNIDVLLNVRLEEYDKACHPAVHPYPSTCPPLQYLNVTIGSQTQDWPAHQSALDIAKQIAAANPDALMILGQPSSPGTWAMSELFHQFHVVRGWTPKAV
jgi:hypothetical protein